MNGLACPIPRKPGVIVAIQLGCSSGALWAAVIAGPVANPANGHIYYLLDTASWTDSEAEARQIGGHLVTIDNQQENEWVFANFSRFADVSRNLWIGLNDAASEGAFVWASGEPFGFSNWASGEPSNGGPSGEHFVHMIEPASSTGEWNDVPNVPTDFGGPPCYGVVEFGAAGVKFDGNDYYENFNGLTGPPWINDGTRPGWFAYRSTGGDNIYWGRADGDWDNITTEQSNSYVTSNGQTGTGLLNVGGTANRALGVRTLNRDITFALVLRNETTNSFACLTLEYYGEQWQQNTSGGSTSGLTFSYGVFETFIESAHPGQRVNPCTIVPHQVNDPDGFNVGYLPAPPLNLNAFVFGGETRALNGDLLRNRQRKIISAPALNWSPGKYLVLRWFADYRNDQISQMLAVDDLRLHATPVGAVEFTQTHLLSSGQLQMILCGTAGDTYDIQTSDDLAPWERAFSVTNITGQVELVVPVGQSGNQFFRAVKSSSALN